MPRDCPGGAPVKNPTINAGDVGRSPRVGNGNPFQYSCLGNLRDRGDWWSSVHEVAKESDMTEHKYTHKMCPRRRCSAVEMRCVRREKKDQSHPGWHQGMAGEENVRTQGAASWRWWGGGD